MSSTRNTIIEYRGHYFILPRDAPSEIAHLGDEARRRFNYHLVDQWMQAVQTGKVGALVGCDGGTSGNKFTGLSSSVRQTMILEAISATLQDIAPVTNLDTDSGQYHMATDGRGRSHGNPRNRKSAGGFVEKII